MRARAILAALAVTTVAVSGDVGGIDAPHRGATFAGLVYAGVTQVNACIPDGVTRSTSVPITFRSGAYSSAPATIDLR